MFSTVSDKSEVLQILAIFSKFLQLRMAFSYKFLLYAVYGKTSFTVFDNVLHGK